MSVINAEADENISTRRGVAIQDDTYCRELARGRGSSPRDFQYSEPVVTIYGETQWEPVRVTRINSLKSIRTS